MYYFRTVPFFEADTVVVATGGLSYPSTGSTGDGYRFAAETGHKVISQSPSLVPLVAKEDYVSKLQGLSLRNVELTVKSGKKVLYKDFGEMMFTHFGVTGPLILSASSQVPKKFRGQELTLSIDLKPALSPEQLDDRLLRDFSKEKNQTVQKLFWAVRTHSEKFLQHSFDEFIGLFLLRKKVVPVVLQAIAFRPAQESAQMCQCLDTGNQINTENLRRKHRTLSAPLL